MVPGCLCAGHPAGDWGGNGWWGTSLPLHPACSILFFLSIFFCVLQSSLSFALLLSPPSSSPSSLLSLNGGSSHVIH